MNLCFVRLIHLLWGGMAAKCLNYLIAEPVTFTQSLLIWICYLMWTLAVLLMVIASVHEWQAEARNLSRKGAYV